MKLSIKERFLILRNRIRCFILPFFGYPTIQNLDIRGSIYVNDIKGVIIKGCVFTPDENNKIEISRKK